MSAENAKQLPGEKMDAIYRFQRHFYDLTRKFFLFGRDELLAKMKINAGDRVLEIGCGTGRNLLKLDRLHPAASLYGLDASSEMLKTAGAKFDARGIEKKIVLRRALAEEFGAKKTFALDEKFDVIFFSYTLSMIPAWQAAVDAALANLKAGGQLYIVDFGDGRGLPGWFHGLLTGWLSLFGVHFRPELLVYLQDLERNGKGELSITPVGGHYAFRAEFRKLL